ncbi:MAG: hypothetical protein U0Y82_02240 [Thermoleophilia bacterium]
MPEFIQVVAAPDAPLGRTDPARRWALRRPDGSGGFAGITRTDAERVADSLAGQVLGPWDGLLVPTTLPVVLSDGAGPYLVDAEGVLVLCLGSHPGAEPLSMAVGQPAPGTSRVGLVRLDGRDPARWVVRADVPDDRRVECLDALAAADDPEGLRRWALRFGGTGCNSVPVDAAGNIYVVRFTAVATDQLPDDAVDALRASLENLPGTSAVNGATGDVGARTVTGEFVLEVEQGMADAARDGSRLAREALRTAGLDHLPLVELVLSLRTEPVG